MHPSSDTHPRIGASACPAASLGDAALGFRGRIRAVDATGYHHGLGPAELERRLLEMGFVEGASVEVRHQGGFGRDPIAVRVNDATVALRRREARAILVELMP
jgi:ferrous iron transport protein A